MIGYITDIVIVVTDIVIVVIIIFIVVIDIIINILSVHIQLGLFLNIRISLLKIGTHINRVSIRFPMF